MTELDEIRKKKLEELMKLQQNNSQQNSEEEMQMQQQIQQLEAVVKQAFTKEALERFGNLKAANPEKAIQVLVILAQAMQQDQIQKIDDYTLKGILKKMTPKKKDINIKRVYENDRTKNNTCF